MSDNNVSRDKSLWFPDEVWATIASFLDNDDLARFRQLCKFTQFIGSHAIILQPFYNRLYAMDNTLPALLPQKSAPLAFKQAAEKVQANQQAEVTYLTQHHPVIIEKLECKQVFQENTTASLQSLEVINSLLDKINSDIIKIKIHANLTSTSLELSWLNITRLPVGLLQDPLYANFWKNLIHLSCNQNKLTELNVQGLTALQTLLCNGNQITTLNVQGLTALQTLLCTSNQITTLNVQGLVVLEILWLENNPLINLNLTGVHVDIKNKYAELERSLLFNELSKTDSVDARQVIINRLGTDYTRDNCLKYCPDYAATLFEVDALTANSALSQSSAFLPSFLGSGLKRKRDEEEACIERPDNQPDLKKSKRK